MDQAQIERIVQQVLSAVASRRDDQSTSPEPAVGPDGGPTAAPGAALGVHPDVDAAIRAAEAAFRQLDGLPLARRGEMIGQIRQTARDYARALAEEAVAETGLGRVEDKVRKMHLVADRTPGTEGLEPTAWSGDRGLTLVERAPYGVIAAITPCTNPTATVFNNAIGMIAAGNAVVFNTHPLAAGVSAHSVALINQAIARAGGPTGLVTCVAEPSIASAQSLMKHPGVGLLVVTGGGGVVHEAMRSGKRAICAGPGNPPVVVDETADLDQAARDIAFGASFDNNILCTDEKEIIVVDAAADQLKAGLKANGAVEINSWQLGRLLKVILDEDRGPGQQSTVNKAWVGRNAGLILKQIGIDAGDDVRLIVAEVDDPRHQLVWTEQLMPIIPIVRVRNADEAIDLAIEAEHGHRHTAIMHSKNLDRLSRMAREYGGSLFVKNGSNLAGLGYGGEGHTSFTIASPTGEGLTCARDFSRVRRCTLVDAFRIV